MRLSIDERKYLLQRKLEVQREIHDLRREHRGPCYHEMNDRRVELIDELNRIEGELQAASLE